MNWDTYRTIVEECDDENKGMFLKVECNDENSVSSCATVATPRRSEQLRRKRGEVVGIKVEGARVRRHGLRIRFVNA